MMTGDEFVRMVLHQMAIGTGQVSVMVVQEMVWALGILTLGTTAVVVKGQE